MTALASAPATEFENSHAFLLWKHCYNRKNWPFADSERAGRRCAAIQSLFATAKLNGRDPARWLADTLEKLPPYNYRPIRFINPVLQLVLEAAML